MNGDGDQGDYGGGDYGGGFGEEGGPQGFDDGLGGGYGGNGGDSFPFPIVPGKDSLTLQHEQAVTEAEIRRLEAEAELNRSQTEFLSAQVGEFDPKNISLAQLMPGEKGQGFPWLLIGVALLFTTKILK